jgi:putative FmdB family regulatory protein
MPTYVFRCPKCDHRIEEIRSVEDRNKQTRCAKCRAWMFRMFVPESVRVLGAAKHEIFRPFKERVKRALHGHEQRGTLNNVRVPTSTLKRVYGSGS